MTAIKPSETYACIPAALWLGQDCTRSKNPYFRHISSLLQIQHQEPGGAESTSSTLLPPAASLHPTELLGAAALGTAGTLLSPAHVQG